MKTKIIILITVIIIIAISGCTTNNNNDINKINQLSPSINEHISNGDESFNKSATYINSKNSESCLNETENAITEYNAARTSISEALNYAENKNDTVYINYLKIVIQEIDSKLNATTELQEAATLFNKNHIYDGNKKLNLANEHMEKSEKYKEKRNDLVKQNQNKFQ